MTTTKVGIIGAGQIARLHAEGYAKDERAEIRAVCDIEDERAIEEALAWKADRWYTDHKALLADPEIDAVDILTPHHLHPSMILEALRAGKHVMVQRPLALTIAEADEVIAEASKRQLTLAVAEPHLYHPPFADARSYLKNGEIGDPLGIHFSVNIGAPEGGWEVKPQSWLWRFDPRKCGGGPFLFDSIYTAFAISTHLLSEVESVNADIGRTEISPGYFVDAPGTVTWRHNKGRCLGSLNMTYSPDMYIKSTHYPNDVRVELTGTKGIIWFRVAPGNVTMGAPLQMYRDGRLFSFGEVAESWDENFHHTTRNFIDAVRGQAKLVMTPQAGREILRMTLAARESSAKP